MENYTRQQFYKVKQMFPELNDTSSYIAICIAKKYFGKTDGIMLMKQLWPQEKDCQTTYEKQFDQVKTDVNKFSFATLNLWINTKQLTSSKKEKKGI